VNVAALREGDAPTHESLRDIPRLAHLIRDVIVQSSSPVVLTHANPDADAVAAALGMSALCELLGRPPLLVSAGDHALPDNLGFLRGALRLKDVDDDAIAKADLLLAVDCADFSRLGPLYYRLQDEFERHRVSVNVDHHITNARFATHNLVVPVAAATSEIIARMFNALALGIEPDVSTALLAGIYGDTLGLRTPSTTPSTLRVSAELIEAGADLDTIVDSLFRLKPYSTICLWGEVLQQATWRGALIWTAVYPAMLDRTGASRDEAEGIVNFLAGAIGARAAAMLYQEPWGWRVSLRSLSEEVDVSELAQRHGGGGHARAAGCRLPPGELAREQFLDDIAAQLGPVEVVAATPSRSSDPV